MFWERVEPPPPRTYLIGVDLGQARDPSAVIVAEKSDGPTGARYGVGHVERLPLNSRYPAVVAHVRSVVAAILAERPKPSVTLVVDRTGVGRAVGDLMTAETVGIAPILVTITAGDAVTRADDGGWRVPKRELASVIQAALETSRLEFAGDEPLLNALKEELTGFRAKIKLATGHTTFEAGDDWRSAPHDDLVLALALAMWAGEAGLATSGWDHITDANVVAFFQEAGVVPW